MTLSIEKKALDEISKIDTSIIPSAEPERVGKILNQSEGFYSAHGVCICGHCEHCGNTVCDEFRFCPYCGTKLDWSE